MTAKGGRAGRGGVAAAADSPPRPVIEGARGRRRGAVARVTSPECIGLPLKRWSLIAHQQQIGPEGSGKWRDQGAATPMQLCVRCGLARILVTCTHPPHQTPVFTGPSHPDHPREPAGSSPPSGHTRRISSNAEPMINRKHSKSLEVPQHPGSMVSVSSPRAAPLAGGTKTIVILLCLAAVCGVAFTSRAAPDTAAALTTARADAGSAAGAATPVPAPTQPAAAPQTARQLQPDAAACDRSVRHCVACHYKRSGSKTLVSVSVVCTPPRAPLPGVPRTPGPDPKSTHRHPGAPTPVRRAAPRGHGCCAPATHCRMQTHARLPTTSPPSRPQGFCSVCAPGYVVRAQGRACCECPSVAGPGVLRPSACLSAGRGAGWIHVSPGTGLGRGAALSSAGGPPAAAAALRRPASRAPLGCRLLPRAPLAWDQGPPPPPHSRLARALAGCGPGLAWNATAGNCHKCPPDFWCPGAAGSAESAAANPCPAGRITRSAGAAAEANCGELREARGARRAEQRCSGAPCS